MENKKPLAVDCKGVRVFLYNNKCKFTKYLAFLQALSFFYAFSLRLFNRLKKSKLCKI